MLILVIHILHIHVLIDILHLYIGISMYFTEILNSTMTRKRNQSSKKQSLKTSIKHFLGVLFGFSKYNKYLCTPFPALVLGITPVNQPETDCMNDSASVFRTIFPQVN